MLQFCLPTRSVETWRVWSYVVRNHRNGDRSGRFRGHSGAVVGPISRRNTNPTQTFSTVSGVVICARRSWVWIYVRHQPFRAEPDLTQVTNLTGVNFLWSEVTIADPRNFQAQVALCGHIFAVQSD